MSCLSTFAEHLPPNDRLILVLKEVEKTHKNQNEVKRIIRLVKNEKEIIIFELKKFEQLFNTYNQLQNRLTQLLNKNQELAKHKLDLFKIVHKIAIQLKETTIDTNIDTNIDGKSHDNKSDNNANNNNSTKQLTPLCLKEEDIIHIKVNQTVTNRIFPSELEYLPDLPVINRFHLNESQIKANHNNNGNDNRNKNSNKFKKIEFVYNCTLKDPNNERTQNTNTGINNDRNTTNNDTNQLFDNTVVSNTSSKEVVRTTECLSDIHVANAITFCSSKEPQNYGPENEFKISEEIDNELKEENSLLEGLTQDHSLTPISNSQLQEDDDVIDETQDKEAIQTKMITNCSHISKLRKNLKETEDRHMFEVICVEKYTKHTKDTNAVINFKKKHNKNDSKVIPKKMQSIISSVPLKAISNKNSRKTTERDKNKTNEAKVEKKDKKCRDKKSKSSKRRDEKNRKDKYRHESKSQVLKSLIKDTIETKDKNETNEPIVENKEKQNFVEKDDGISNNDMKKETIINENYEQTNKVKIYQINDNTKEVSELLTPKAKRAKLMFKLERNRNFSANMISNSVNLPTIEQNSFEQKEPIFNNNCVSNFEELYNKNLESQKKLRADLLRQKEERRKNRATHQLPNVETKSLPKNTFVSSIKSGVKASLVKNIQLNAQKQKLMTDVLNKSSKIKIEFNSINNSIQSESQIQHKSQPKPRDASIRTTDEQKSHTKAGNGSIHLTERQQKYHSNDIVLNGSTEKCKLQSKISDPSNLVSQMKQKLQSKRSDQLKTNNNQKNTILSNDCNVDYNKISSNKKSIKFLSSNLDYGQISDSVHDSSPQKPIDCTSFNPKVPEIESKLSEMINNNKVNRKVVLKRWPKSTIIEPLIKTSVNETNEKTIESEANLHKTDSHELIVRANMSLKLESKQTSLRSVVLNKNAAKI